MVRKSIKRAGRQANIPHSPVINLLVVTARPNEEHDVGYRSLLLCKHVPQLGMGSPRFARI
uniref:hypothetical protein n=1 Tax=Brasilonema sp. UFV-L1 TaxID=2234130 RepID=UPI0030D96D15